MNQDLSGT